MAGLCAKSGHPLRKSHGFSLIEVTIGLLVLGILIIPTISYYEKYRQEHIRAASENYPRSIAAALRKYAILYGRYPRPADPNVSANDPSFGNEIAAGSYPDCTPNSTTVCQTDSTTQGSFDSRVLIGTVPFAEIGLPRELAFDGYGRLFTYAVTEILTDPGSFDDNGGVIAVWTGIYPDDPSTPEDDTLPLGVTTNNIHFVVVSHGPNGAGAFTTAGGDKFMPCSSAGATFEQDNCNNDWIFQEHMEVYEEEDPVTGTTTYERRKARNEADNDEYFDDTLAFNTTTAASDWTRIATDTDIVSRTGGKIQIGTDPAAPDLPDATIDVYGNVRSNALETDQLCDEDNGCTSYEFYPALIGGTPEPVTSDGSTSYIDNDGINCGDQALTGIKNANELCVYAKAPGLSLSCPSSKGMTGVSAGGSAICVTP